MSFKNRRSPSHFLRYNSQKIKNEKRDCFFYILFFNFSCFSCKNWFTQLLFDLPSSLTYIFEQNQPLNLFIYERGWHKSSCISKQKLIQPSIWSMIIFLILIAKRPFPESIFKQKNMEVPGWVLKKWKFCK